MCICVCICGLFILSNCFTQLREAGKSDTHWAGQPSDDVVVALNCCCCSLKSGIFRASQQVKNIGQEHVAAACLGRPQHGGAGARGAEEAEAGQAAGKAQGSWHWSTTGSKAEMRNSILAQVLDQSARAQLSNLALVKPEKTKAVENYLIQMAWYGQLSGKVSEQGLIEILEKVSQQTEKKTTVKFNRRKVMDSDEDDDY